MKNKLFQRKNIILSLWVVTLIFLSSCFIQKITENASQIAEGFATLIKGSLGLGYSHADDSVSGTSAVDKVWAVPLKIASGTTAVGGIFGEYDPQNPDQYVTYYKEFPIRDLTGSTTNFTIDVDSLKGNIVQNSVFNGDWLFILVNTNKVGTDNLDDVPMSDFPAFVETRKDALVSFIGISENGSTGEPETLIRMPIESIVQDSVIDLGNVNKSTDGTEAQSTNTIDENASKINLSVEKIKELATVDTIFKSIKNNYINFIKAGVHYFWNGSTNFQKLKDTAGRSAAELVYTGSQFTFNYRTDMWSGFADENTNLTLEVPGEVVHTDEGGFVEDDTTAPATVTTYKAGDRISLLTTPEGNIIFEGKIKNFIPSGWFRLLKDNTAYGYYDFAIINPFVGNTTDYANIYMPLLTIYTDGGSADEKITGVKVDWYIYDSTTGSYKLLDDYNLLYSMVDYAVNDAGQTFDPSYMETTDFVVSFQGTNTDNNAYQILMKNESQRTALVETDWYFPPANAGDENGSITKYARLIKVLYNYAGFNFQFYWCENCVQ